MYKLFKENGVFRKLYNYDKHFRQLALSRYYFIFTVIFIFLIVSFSLLIGTSDYHIYKDNQKRELEQCSAKIENDFNSLFDTIFHIQTFMGKQIVEHGARDLSYILRLFRNYNEVKNHASILYSWDQYDWVDPSLHAVIASSIGKIKPMDLRDRYYLQQTKQTPWHLYISTPIRGYITGASIIGAGMGVADAKKKYLGSILVGINLEQLTKRLSSSIKSSKIHFIIMDEAGKIILTSNREGLVLQDKLERAEHTLFKPPMVEGMLENSIENNTITYSYFRKLSHYPYVLLVGFDNNIAQKEMLMLLLPQILEYICLGIACLMLLAFFKYWFINPVQVLCDQATNLVDPKSKFDRSHIKSTEFFYLNKALLYVKRHLQRKQRMQKKLEKTNQALRLTNAVLSSKKLLLEESQDKLQKAINISKESDLAKEEFSRQVNSDLRSPLNIILDSTRLMYEQTHEQPRLHKNDLITMELETIYQAALELKGFTKIDMKFHLVNIKNIIDDCMNIHRKIAFNKKINFKLSMQENLPMIYADKFRLKQAVVSLLHRAISGSPFEGLVQITCSNVSFDGQKFVQLLIEDNGFGLSESDFKRIKSSFSNIECADVMALELETIKQLIELHHGKLEVDVIFGEGTKVLILLPISQLKSKTNTTNIYTLHPISPTPEKE